MKQEHNRWSDLIEPRRWIVSGARFISLEKPSTQKGKDMSKGDHPYVDVELLEIKKETDSAILIVTKDDREVWIPLSQVSTIRRSTPPSIEVAEWLASNEDLI